MRIIAGRHRGRRLVAPVGHETTRPITDRVKQSLFDRLMAADVLEDAVVADLFAGTGSMGLECLSRGSAFVTFVERDRSALNGLNENLEMFRETESARVLSMDALGAAVVDVLRGRPCTLLFVDPPYAVMSDEGSRGRVMQQIERLAEASTAGALLVLRVESHIEAQAAAGWDGPEVHGYGSMTLHFYHRSG
jgi:16S rRNA (guanine(966)-N(2))-methyltransferase RsmD